METTDTWQFMHFSKHLQSLPLDKMTDKLKKIGIESLDLTVRPGGHVEPEKVEEDLPRICEALGKHGVSVGMITTNIRNAMDPLTRKILRVAARLGVKYYKLGYFVYEGFGKQKAQVEHVRTKIRELAELNGELGVHGGFHNHSGSFFGASLWQVAEVISDVCPDTIGCYLDPAHAVIEGGRETWRMGMDLLADRVTMLAVKDFRWVAPAKDSNCRGQVVQICPLSMGNVPWKRVIEALCTIGFKGPVSFHGEYQGEYSFSTLDDAEVIRQTGEDIEFFQQNCPRDLHR